MYEYLIGVVLSILKFTDDFEIVLFHYDGRTTEWDQYEWSKQAIHISIRKQTKWWYATRFLHQDSIAAYDYIFVWDEDLGGQGECDKAKRGNLHMMGYQVGEG